MKITDYGKAVVHSDKFREHLNMRLFQLFVNGTGPDDIRGMLRVYVAMALCMGPDNRLSMAKDELAPFMNKHSTEIEEVLEGAMHYAGTMAGVTEFNPTRVH